MSWRVAAISQCIAHCCIHTYCSFTCTLNGLGMRGLAGQNLGNLSHLHISHMQLIQVKFEEVQNSNACVKAKQRKEGF